MTGAGGFIGSRVVATLINYGFKNIRAFVRNRENAIRKLRGTLIDPGKIIEFAEGNLLSKEDCEKATERVAVIYHLAASTSEKSFSASFLNSVVTTRNLLEAAMSNGVLRRFVNVSSFAVYTSMSMPRGGLLDETCPIESHFLERGDAYLYGKIKQENLLLDYAKRFNIPYVIIRPGAVFGPGKEEITGRVGINTFGFFLHLGGSNQIPFTYVDNCAEAIVLAGLIPGVDGEVFNIVDDNLPSSRQFLRVYKKKANHFFSLFVPYSVFYFFCWKNC